MSGCRPDPPQGALEARTTADGSLTLWSEHFGEAFHSGQGAHAEALNKFVAPAQLERFAAGSVLRVLDVCVGLGYNTAALLEAAEDRGLRIEWIGLELDPRPLGLALSNRAFRALWRPASLTALEQLHHEGRWSSGFWLLGDARTQLAQVLHAWEGQCDLVLHDAFSPGHCPELWTVEFLGGLARLLNPQGRLLTYCAAAAVREALRLAGLHLASIVTPDTPAGAAGDQRRVWCAGTAASPTPFAGLNAGSSGGNPLIRGLCPMEIDHLRSRAAEPYRDPDGNADAATIQRWRAERQRLHPGESTSAWRRRWGLAR